MHRSQEIDGILTKLNGANNLSVLDSSEAIYVIKLDYKHSLFSTVATFYGRYKFSRLHYYPKFFIIQ